MKKFTIEYAKEFCKSLELECVSIPLYRIPYTKYDEIPEIINEIINQ